MALSKAALNRIRQAAFALVILLFAAFAVQVGWSPWTLVTDPEWLGPTRHVYALKTSIWILGTSVLAMAGLWLFTAKARPWEWGVGLLCCLGVLLAWFWLGSLEAPVFLG